MTNHRMKYIRILIYSGGVVEKLFIFPDGVMDVDMAKLYLLSKLSEGDGNGDEENVHESIEVHPEGSLILKGKKKKFNLRLNAYAFSYFIHVLKISSLYRFLVVKNIFCKIKPYAPNTHSSTLSVTLHEPPEQYIDYNWCHRVSHLVMERSELDSAMSWLSTLGGAYSALGDEFSHCAQMAGRISFRQFQLALRLGDENTVSRCKLYIALSLIQYKRFKMARHIIEEQFRLATNSQCPDSRLVRMCRGIWSKLRYERLKCIQKKRKG